MANSQQQVTGSPNNGASHSSVEASYQHLASLVSQLVRQQTEFNRVVTEQLKGLQQQLQEMGDLLVQLDRDHSGQVRDLANLAVPLAQLHRLLGDLETRVSELERKVDRGRGAR